MACKGFPRFIVLWVYCTANTSLAQTIVVESQYRFQHFETKDGLPDNFVSSIAQDSLGYMWFQYYGGLTRFDGYSFKVYKHDPDDSLRSTLNSLGHLKVDGNKNIWINPPRNPAGSPFTLIKHDPKTDGFIKFIAPLEWKLITDEEFDRSNPHILWLGSTESRGLLSWNMKTNEINNHPIPSHDKETFVQENSGISSIDMGPFLLLATRNGIWSFNKERKTFKRPSCNPKDSSFIYHAPFYAILGKIKENIWLLGPNELDQRNLSLVRLGPDLTVLLKYDIPSGVYFGSLDIDAEENVWIGSWNDGLYRFSPKNSSFINIRNVPGDPSSLRSNRVVDVRVDRDQNIWVATEKGVSKLYRNEIETSNRDHIGEPGGPGGIYKTRTNEFIVTVNGGVDPPYNTYEMLLAQVLPGKVNPLPAQRLPTPRIETNIIIQFLQGKRNFWVSTYPTGILRYPINPKTEMIADRPPQQFLPDPSNPNNTITPNRIGGIWEDEEENLWVGGDGLQKLIHGTQYGEKGSVVSYKHLEGDTNSISSNSVMGIYPENDSSIWVITDAGVDLFHRNVEKFDHVFKNREMPSCLYIASDGMVFLGTLKGLYEVTKEQDRLRFDKHPIWDRGEVKGIQEDRLGRLWLASSVGLICYDRKQKVAVEFNENDGVLFFRSNNTFTLRQTSQGVMFMVDHGLTLFDPMSLTIDLKETTPVLTKLDVNNKVAVISEGGNASDNFSLATDIGVLDELILDYQHNNFSIEFSAMEFTAPEKNLYRHKLEGFDKDWIQTDYKTRTATYTNLDAGTYTFKVKASNHHGIWSDKEKTLIVKILPPPWKTWWAYTGYSLVVLGLLVGARRMILQRERLKANLRLAKVKQEKDHFELEKAKEVDQLKTRFFTNISHEFRTPITLVLGPLKDLQKQISNLDQKSIVESVIRNGLRLQRLINQLLDISKVEAGKMKLTASHTDLVQLLREITSSYESLAKEKGIRYFFHPEANELMAYIDEEKIEKIIHNLLSNAFKFTKKGGQVILNLKVQEKSAVIAVTDSGIGIPKDQVNKIFDRFYQVDSSQTRDYEGSGLGLALAKNLVELHHGKIAVDSKEGNGTIFTVILPLGKEHLQNDEIAELDETIKAGLTAEDFVPSNGEETVIQSEERTENEGASGIPLLLIVEDNPDMRQYIRKSLSPHYQINEAENGKEGVVKAEESIPDLIISDIMMPEMDGYKLCSFIKGNELTSHIPVILLTAKADRESKLSGLEIGADDYLSKPFDADELRLIVRNHIQEKRNMREHFSKEITLEPKQIVITSLDHKFIVKVMALIEAHMDDENFSIEDFSQEAGCSRMQFYRKIKGLTDQTPSRFVRSIRLKRAAQLLSEKSDNVTQIAYSVGFSSLAYFNKCFKEQFGITPGQYAAVNNQI